MKATFPLPLLLLLPLFAATVLAEEFRDLETLRLDFQSDLAKIEKPLRDLGVKYRSHLEKQKADYQQAGNLKAVLAADDELKKPSEELSTFPEIAELQKIYREHRAKLESGMLDGKLALIQSYREQAGKLAEQWTKAGNIEEARLAQAEEERFASMEKSAEMLKKAGETAASGPAARNAANFEGSKAGEEMKNSLRMELCWIPAGKFLMGSPENEPGREAHKEAQVEVELTRGFWMGKHEVTQGEYERIMGDHETPHKDLGDDIPVGKVNWDDAMSFCAALTEREREKGNLPVGWIYTLPTEAQWEYACRAGETGPYSGGTLDEVGWYKENSEGRPHEVGKKKPNAWGLHDMHGNVLEWCTDWFGAILPGGKNPIGSESGTHRTLRGGGYAAMNADPARSRAAHRGAQTPDREFFELGFRVVCRPE